MSKRRGKRKFSIIRFISLIIIAFVFTYILSAGLSLIQSQNWQNADDYLPVKNTSENISENTSEKGAKNNSDISYRIKRAIFIKNEVNLRINKKNFVKINEMPRDLIHAIVAVEDSRFYSHHGFDIEAIGRASIVNLQSGRIEEGASTITQQLVKNLFLSQEQTFDRKIEELILAFDLETVYSKEEILELYLNTIYFGSNFYGIKEAAEGYFAKKPKDLTLEESAMLAGLPNAPSLYSPYVDLELAKKRQKIVIDAMEQNGYIISSTAEKAKIAPLYFARE